MSLDNSFGVYSSRYFPRKSILPERGGIKAERVRRRVDFPAPLTPSKQVSSPLFKQAVKSFDTTRLLLFEV